MARNTYVVKKRGSGWDVLREGDRRASAHAKTKTDAVNTAKKLSRSAGGGEVLVLGRAGKITQSDKISRPARASVKSARSTSARTTSKDSGRRPLRSLRSRLAR